jgi:hypothetical protein
MKLDTLDLTGRPPDNNGSTESTGRKILVADEAGLASRPIICTVADDPRGATDRVAVRAPGCRVWTSKVARATTGTLGHAKFGPGMSSEPLNRPVPEIK